VIGEATMKSTVHKRSISLAGHKTSVSLEDAFWQALRDISEAKNLSVSVMINRIDRSREHHNLSSAIRLHVLDYYRSQVQASAQTRIAA